MPAFLVGCEDAGGEASAPVDTTTVTSAVTVTPTASWVSRVGLTSTQYQAEFNNWNSKGFRPVYVSGYAYNGQDYYAAIWENSTGTGWTGNHAMTPAAFAQQITNNAGSYHLAMANGYTVNGGDLYVAVWEAGTTPAVAAKYPLTASQVPTTVSAQAKLGYRAIQISGYGGSTEEFLILFKKAPGPKQLVRAGQTADQFSAEYVTDTNQGYHLTQVNAYSFAGTTHYVSIYDFGASSVPQQVKSQLDQSTTQQTINELRYQGYRPVNLSGGVGGQQVVNGQTVNVTTPTFQGLWQNYSGMTSADLNYIDTTINNELSGSGTAAISLAVAKNGRLVFSKAYGFADTASGTAATTASVFRLASISKTITSTAVLWLADHGYLSVEDYVFGPSSIFGTNTYPYPQVGCRNTGVPCVEDIKVKDLLAMTTGGWCSDTGSTDPVLTSMFDACHDNCLTGSCEDGIIGWTLGHQPLDVMTETKYGYSNFNYVVLAKIIQQVTGQPYAKWVQQNLLIPVGATGMQIGNNAVSQKVANEVTYYPTATGCAGPYSFNIHLMEGNGGWVASPNDLVRFMNQVDGQPSPPDILAPATQNEMISNQAWLLTNHLADGGYGMGWYLGQNSGDIASDPTCTANLGEPACMRFGNGDLNPGTNTEMGNTAGGTSWAVVANAAVGAIKKDPTCQDPGCVHYSLYDDIVKPVLNNVSAWPSYDLLQQPDLAIYDPPTPGAASTQCTAGNTTMHCCPTGYVMIGADDGMGVLKCAPVLTTGAVTPDPAPGGSAYQCNGMHCCPPDQVMVGLRADQNILACMALPPGSLTTQRVDYKTHDAYPIHVCDAATPFAAMTGINVSQDQLTCATDPHLQ